jgi:hypothetical protein
MKDSVYRVVCLWFAMTVFAGSVIAKEWRGIVPLKSTRADVERLLGKPSSSGYYNLPNEIVSFEFQRAPCDDPMERFGYGWNVTPGTVTEIGIIPKGAHRKDEYQLAKDSKVEDNGFGLVYYFDNEAGLMVETYNGLVTLVAYYPKSSEEQLRCPQVQTCCIDFFTTFDEYGTVKFEDEKARLDNFAIQINNSSGRGTLVVFGPSRKIRAQQMKHAARVKDYLVKRRGVEPQRLLIMDGGYATTSYTRLSTYPIGQLPLIYLRPEKDP